MRRGMGTRSRGWQSHRAVASLGAAAHIPLTVLVAHDPLTESVAHDPLTAISHAGLDFYAAPALLDTCLTLLFNSPRSVALNKNMATPTVTIPDGVTVSTATFTWTIQ